MRAHMPAALLRLLSHTWPGELVLGQDMRYLIRSHKAMVSFTRVTRGESLTLGEAGT